MPEKDPVTKPESDEPTVGINSLAEALKVAMGGAIAEAKPPVRDPGSHVMASVYAPAGVEKVPFTRRYFWKNAEIDWNMVTPEEAELLEALQPCKCHPRTTSNPQGGPERTIYEWTVRHRTDGNTAELFIDFPAGDADMRASLPSMKAMLKEMVFGVPAD